MHNIVTVAMHQYGIDIQGAMGWISKYHEQLVNSFLRAAENLPTWSSEIDAQVTRYVDGVGNWVRGTDSWGFESRRYFGSRGLEIQTTREVALLPKVTP